MEELPGGGIFKRRSRRPPTGSGRVLDRRLCNNFVTLARELGLVRRGPPRSSVNTSVGSGERSARTGGAGRTNGGRVIGRRQAPAGSQKETRMLTSTRPTLST